jgi:hypothetical protein
MGTTPGSNESGLRPSLQQKTLPAASLLLALAMAFASCSKSDPPGGADDEGGSGDTDSKGGAGGKGGKGGAGGKGGSSSTGGKGGINDTAGEGGSSAGTGGGSSTGGSAGADASVAPTEDGGAPEDALESDTGMAQDMTSGSPTDGPPALMRPDAMGQACKSAANENFTVSAFDVQKGVFTAWFTATPSIAPTNSVIGLSDGDVGPGSGNTPLHNLHQVLLRFGASGALDARNGTVYAAETVIKYEAIPYDFRLVVDVPNKKYSAYVSWKGQPEVTIGTNFAYRETAAVPTKFDHWAVQSVAAKTTVCDFIVRAN